MLRFADSDVLPYAFGPSADTIATYVIELKKLLAAEHATTAQPNALVADGSFIEATDPRCGLRLAGRFRTRGPS